MCTKPQQTAEKNASYSRRFEFVSYSETYADYLAALETPALLLPYVLTTPAKGPFIKDVRKFFGISYPSPLVQILTRSIALK